MAKHNVPRGSRVLLLEDDEDLREELRDLLQSKGFTVSAAPNGKEGLARLRSESDVGVIVLDVAMPVMNGATFRGEQLSDASLASIPVVLLTGRDDMRALARALDVQCAVAKPRLEGLVDAVRTCLAPLGADFGE